MSDSQNTALASLSNLARTLVSALSTALSDILFGPSPTVLIAQMASQVVVDLLQEQLGLSEQEQDDIRRRAAQASQYLSEAGQILSELQGELEQRNRELEALLAEIDFKRAEAEHWEEIAKMNERLASALTTEIERRVREQLRKELDRNKTRRQVVAAIMWVITLFAGGIVGAIIQQWWQSRGVLLP